MDELRIPALTNESRFGRTIHKLISPPWIELGALVVVCCLYLYNAFRFSQPIGYAGLFSLMTEILENQPFPLPSYVPFYGPEGMPFAYPPVGLYVAYLFVGILKIPLFSYLRWAPPLYTILAFVCMYLYFLHVSNDRIKSILAVLIISTAELIYVNHATAAGMVRGIALILAMSGVLFALLAYRSERNWLSLSVVGAFLFAMTLMTHLSYAVFLLLGVILMAFLADGWQIQRDRLKVLGIILVGGLVLASPWWATIGFRHGFQVFINAGSTHGTLGIIKRASGEAALVPLELLRWYINIGRSWWPTFFSGLTMLGFAYAVWRRDWLLPVWMIGIVSFLGETDRFELLISGMLIAILLVEVFRFDRVVNKLQGPWLGKAVPTLVFLVLAVGPFFAQGIKGIQRSRTMLTEDLLEMATWVRENTSTDDRYMYMGDEQYVQEWLPFLTRRTPLVAHWGSEWKGTYQIQQDRMSQVTDCIRAQSFHCVLELLDQWGRQPQILIQKKEDVVLTAEVSLHPDWNEVYVDDEFVIYQLTGK